MNRVLRTQQPAGDMYHSWVRFVFGLARGARRKTKGRNSEHDGMEQRLESSVVGQLMKTDLS
ncbi:MAG TPA: hypothetical protein VIY49_35140 [Bryobacteraceae bacterium]